MNVLFCLAGDTLGAAWNGGKVSHTLTHSTVDAELIIIYRENPFFENFIKVTNEPSSVLAPGESFRGA